MTDETTTEQPHKTWYTWRSPDLKNVTASRYLTRDVAREHRAAAHAGGFTVLCRETPAGVTKVKGG